MSSIRGSDGAGGAEGIWAEAVGVLKGVLAGGGEGQAPAPDEVGTLPAAAPSARARSVDLGGLTLQQQLEQRLAAREQDGGGAGALAEAGAPAQSFVSANVSANVAGGGAAAPTLPPGAESKWFKPADVKAEIDFLRGASADELLAHCDMLMMQNPQAAAHALRALAAVDQEAFAKLAHGLGEARRARHSKTGNNQEQQFVYELARLDGPTAGKVREAVLGQLSIERMGSKSEEESRVLNRQLEVLKLAIENPEAGQVMGEFFQDPKALADRLELLQRTDPAAYQRAMTTVMDRCIGKEGDMTLAPARFVDAVRDQNGDRSIEVSMDLATRLYNRGVAERKKYADEAVRDIASEPYFDEVIKLVSEPDVGKAWLTENPEQLQRLLTGIGTFHPRNVTAAIEPLARALVGEVAAAARSKPPDEAALSRAANDLGVLLGMSMDAIEQNVDDPKAMLSIGEKLFDALVSEVAGKVPLSGLAEDAFNEVVGAVKGFAVDAAREKWGGKKEKIVAEFRDRLLRLAAAGVEAALDPDFTKRNAKRHSDAWNSYWNPFKRFEEQVVEGYNRFSTKDITALPRG